MFPPGSPSSVSVHGAFLAPDDAERNLLLDYERGGVHVNDPSAGLNYQDWKMWYDGTAVKLSTVSDTDVSTVFTAGLVTELAFTFDQNMRLAMVYVQAGVAKLRWYNPLVNAIVTDTLFGATSPMIGLDDKRERFLQDSDIIVGYVKDGAVYYRLQRERFITEHHLADLPANGGTHRIMNFGMTSRGRFEIAVKTEG